MHVIKTREIPMTLLAPSHSPLTPEEGLPQLPALLRYEQERAHGRPKYPARSPVFPQAPTEPRPAALVYPARSQTHSVGPTPQDGPRPRREDRSALFSPTLTAHGSGGDVGEVAPFTEKHPESQVPDPEDTACPAVVGPVRPASPLSSPDTLCCNQVGWGCPSRCRQ